MEDFEKGFLKESRGRRKVSDVHREGELGKRKREGNEQSSSA